MKESDRPAPRQANFFNIDDFRGDDFEHQSDERRFRKVGRNVINLKTQPKLAIEDVMKKYFLEGDLDTVEVMLRAESKSDTPEDALSAVLELAAESYMSEPEAYAELEEAERAREASRYVPPHNEDPDSNITPIGVMKYDSHPASEIPQDPSGRDRVIPIDRSAKNRS